jgi:hypothetical protein
VIVLVRNCGQHFHIKDVQKNFGITFHQEEAGIHGLHVRLQRMLHNIKYVLL